MLRNLLILGLLSASLSFAQAADTTVKSKSIQGSNSTSSTVVLKTLKKQQKVKTPTTWSKIKDLFM